MTPPTKWRRPLFCLAFSVAQPGITPGNPLQQLASILAEASQQWVKALGHAQHVHRHGARDDVDDFLTAIDRLAALEHDADDEERAVTVAALSKATDFRQFHLMWIFGRGWATPRIA